MTKVASTSLYKGGTEASRIDRLVTLFIARSVRTPDSAAVPVLMYHSIADKDEAGIHSYYRTCTSPAVFADHMSFLKATGYTTIGLPELVARLEEPADCCRLVAITFDDGYHDFYRNALPVLHDLDFKATVFLATDFIGHGTSTSASPPVRRQLHGKDCMTWNEVREARRNGISFGSHTMTHPQLRDLSMDEVAEQITFSKQLIEQELGCAVESFAYPYAFPETDKRFVARLRAYLTQAGYLCGVCTSIGRVNRASDRLVMKRLPINSCDDSKLFQAKLKGAYDWLGAPQRWFKITKDWLSDFKSR
jgi:peptidoglycan/xylan/chitin deacetylase (PgdA/CDA1 family)